MSTEPEWSTDPLTKGEHAAAASASGQHLHNGAPSVPAPLTRVQNGPVVIDPKYIPSVSLNPRNIESLEGVDEQTIGYVRGIINAFGSIHGGLQRLSDAREKLRGDSSRTDANKVLLLAGEAEKLAANAAKDFDGAIRDTQSAIKGTEDMLNNPLTAKADNHISGEIRAYLRGLKPGEREKEIERAIAQKDMTVLQACLGAPAMLSGLSPELQQHWTRKYRELTQPDVAKRLDVMKRALALAEKYAPLVHVETEKALGARWDVVQKLRKASSETERMLLLVNNPVQS